MHTAAAIETPSKSRCLSGEPCAAGSSVQPGSETDEEWPTMTRGHYILIVAADEPMAVEIGRELGQRHAVLVASSLPEAHALIDAHDANICAVVSTALLPSGRAFFQHPKTLWARVPWAARVILAADNGRVVDPLGAVIVPRPHLPGDVERAIGCAMREPLPPLGDD